jgi:hypothetical protein
MSRSTTLVGVAGRAGSMPGWPVMVWAQVRLNHTTLLRQRGLAFSVLTLPLFLVVLYTINPTAHEMIGGVSARAYVGVGTLAMGCLAAFMSVSAAAVYRREERIYKRLRGTALPIGAIFAGDVAHAVLVGLVQEVIAAGYLIVVLHAPMPRSIPLILVASLIGSVVFCVLALGVSGLLPSNEVAQLASVPVLLIDRAGGPHRLVRPRLLRRPGRARRRAPRRPPERLPGVRRGTGRGTAVDRPRPLVDPALLPLGSSPGLIAGERGVRCGSACRVPV